MTTLFTTWYGTFLVDGADIKAKRLFPQEARAIADRLAATRSGALLEEERTLAADAAGALVAHEKRLAPLVQKVEGGRVPDLPFRPEASGYKPKLFREALLLLAVREANLDLAQHDRLVVQEVRALDDIVRSSNLLAERMREWYAIHAPEVVGAVSDNSELARLIAEHGSREGMSGQVPGLSTDLGVPFPEADETLMQEFAEGLKALYETWQRIESRLTKAMASLAPNTAKLVGPMLGARLIAAAGGLERLATVPSGTVQTLGAENALFRHLKDGSPPPKHGLLFQHEAVNRAPRWQRGKIARALAGKIRIAAAVDAYGDDPTGATGERLLDGFRVRLGEIQKLHAKPPERRPQQGFRGGGPGRPPFRGGGRDDRRRGPQRRQRA